jgi:hypothetical protein
MGFTFAIRIDRPREVIMKNVLALQKLTSTTEFNYGDAKSASSKGCGNPSYLSLLLC